MNPVVVLACLSDDRAFAEAIARQLAHEGPHHVVTIDEDGWSRLAAADLPDILLVDSNLHDPYRFCGTMTREGRLPVIMLGAPAADDWSLAAIAAGARGVIFKSAPLSDILRAVHVVIEGGVWVPRRVLAAAVVRQQDAAISRDGRAEAMLTQALSVREREVLHHAAAGESNKEVAARLGISPATVKAHLMSIYQKLGVRRRSQLAAACHGILPAASHSARLLRAY